MLSHLLARWHQIPKREALDGEQQAYAVEVICRWIERELTWPADGVVHAPHALSPAQLTHVGVGSPIALGNDVQVATDAEAALRTGPRLRVDPRRLLGRRHRGGIVLAVSRRWAAAAWARSATSASSSGGAGARAGGAGA